MIYIYIYIYGALDHIISHISGQKISISTTTNQIRILQWHDYPKTIIDVWEDIHEFDRKSKDFIERGKEIRRGERGVVTCVTEIAQADFTLTLPQTCIKTQSWKPNVLTL